MKYWIKGIILGLVIGLAGSLFGLSSYGTIFERKIGLSWLFHIRGVVPPPSQVAVIAIDGLTGEKLGIPALTREWPRSIHGKLVEALTKKGASTIVFDVDFHKQRSTEDEEIFAKAIKASNRTVLFQRLTGRGKPVTDLSGKIIGSVWVEELLSPVPVLTNAARGLGPFPLPKTEAAVYQFWVFKSSARESPTMPAVALQLQALKIYPQFLRLLESSGIASSIQLPESAEQISNPRELRKMMLDIRNNVVKNNQMQDSLYSALQQSWVIAESSETRLLLQSLVTLYSGDNNRYLNFYGPPGTIKTIPYHAIINGEDPNVSAADLDLTNKTVFIGLSDFYDPGQPDRFYSVFTSTEGVDLSGVEIAATAFGNLLNNESIQIPDTILILIILFTFGLTITLIIYFTPAILGVPLSIVLVAGYIIYTQFLFTDSNIWLPLATPVIAQFPVALFSGLLIQYLQQRHQVRNISEAISYYVPEEVSNALTGNLISQNDINKVTFSTCLATDMAGFSTLAEKMDPGELSGFLNDYFDTLAEPLRKHDVSVTEFRADAIMCAWTGNESDINIRKKPILASLEASKAINNFKARHDAFDASLRIGIESGEVYVGHSGGGGHFVYSIVGDCANTASRIEGLNKYVGTQILVTDHILEGIDDLLTRPIGQFIFVGKTEPLPITEVITLTNDATASQTELCERFITGYELFLKAEWKNASESFKSILDEFPYDGASRFLFTQCQQRIKAEALPENPFVINMTQK